MTTTSHHPSPSPKPSSPLRRLDSEGGPAVRKRDRRAVRTSALSPHHANRPLPNARTARRPLSLPSPSDSDHRRGRPARLEKLLLVLQRGGRREVRVPPSSPRCAQRTPCTQRRAPFAPRSPNLARRPAQTADAILCPCIAIPDGRRGWSVPRGRWCAIKTGFRGHHAP